MGSLFSGIGGLDLGLERAGVGRTIWQVEQDPFCREVLARHWPDADRSVTDVREAGAHNLAPVDVLCGGFPCQDISLAGKGAGLAGERSGLWREFARLIRVFRPLGVVVENVAALVARGLADVLADLAALGFDAEWTTLRASDVGAPHRRERLFVVAWRVPDAERDRLRLVEQRDARRVDGVRHGGQPEPFVLGAHPVADRDRGGCEGERGGRLLDGERPARRDDADRCGGAKLGDTDRTRRQGAKRKRKMPAARGAEWPPAPDDLHAWGRVPLDAQPSVCRVAHGSTAWMADRRRQLKALGNAVVPAQAEIPGRRLVEVLDAR